MIQPTIGRVVHFYPHLDSAPDGDPFAALLAGINADGTINLTVSARDGSTYPVQNVVLVQDDNPTPAQGHYAAWMPFQKGQVPASSAMEQRVAALEDLLKTGGPMHDVFSRVDEAIAHKGSDIAAATDSKFLELGKYLETKFEGIEARLNSLPSAQQPAPPAPPSTQDGAGEATQQQA